MAIRKLRGMIALPEEGALAGREKISRIQGWMHNFGKAVVVWPLLDHEDAKGRVGFGESTRYDAAGETTFVVPVLGCLVELRVGLMHLRTSSDDNVHLLQIPREFSVERHDRSTYVMTTIREYTDAVFHNLQRNRSP
jgi:hypothetical protein